MGYEKYFKVVEDLIQDLKSSQVQNIKMAANIIADSIMNGGIIHTFGSGHSYAASIEVAGRAGGLIPAKAIEDPSRGMFETVEGVGTKFMENFDLRDKDSVIIISNSGRNPVCVEIADFVKKYDNKLIAVTSLEASKNLKSRHSSGKNLYQFADVVLDNRVMEGDSSVEIEGMPVKVGPTSSVAAAVLLNSAVVEAIEIMLSKGYTPPVYMSANIDGGPEFNKKLTDMYADRLYRK